MIKAGVGSLVSGFINAFATVKVNVVFVGMAVVKKEEIVSKEEERMQEGLDKIKEGRLDESVQTGFDPVKGKMDEAGNWIR